MSKGIYAGVDTTARKLKKVYAGVNGVARKLKKLYVGVNGIAHQILSGGKLEFYSTGLKLPVSTYFSGQKSARAGEYLLWQTSDVQSGSYIDNKSVEGVFISVDKNLLIEHYLFPDLSQNGGGSNGYCCYSGLATAKDSVIVVGGHRWTTGWGWASTNVFCVSPQLTVIELENLPTASSRAPGTELPSYAVFSGGLNQTVVDKNIYAYDENQIRSSDSALPYQTGQSNAVPFAKKAFFTCSGSSSGDSSAATIIQYVDDNLLPGTITAGELYNGRGLASNDNYLFRQIRSSNTYPFEVYNKSMVKIAEVDFNPTSENKNSRTYYGFKDWLVAAGGYLGSYSSSCTAIDYIDYLDENLVRHSDIEDYASSQRARNMAGGVIGEYLVLLGGFYNNSSLAYKSNVVAVYQNK